MAATHKATTMQITHLVRGAPFGNAVPLAFSMANTPIFVPPMTICIFSHIIMIEIAIFVALKV